MSSPTENKSPLKVAWLGHVTYFTARRYGSAVCAVVCVCPSVCPSICLSQACTVPKRLTIAQGL